jgi:hypothetical protein
MMDQDTIAAVRHSFSSARMATPTEQVMARGQALRRRRRLALAGGAVAAAVAVAITVTALGGGRPEPRGPGGGSLNGRAHLTAWTVVKEPNQVIRIEVRQLANLQGLNAALRADGARTVVSLEGTHPVNCQEWTQKPSSPHVVYFGPTVTGDTDSGTIVILHLSALPANAMVWIQVIRNGYYGVTSSKPVAKGSIAAFQVEVFNATSACANSPWARN